MMPQEKFNKYIDFAKSIMKVLPPEEVPTDLTDTHMFVKACDMFDGYNHHLGEEDLRDAMGAVSGDCEAVSLSKVIDVWKSGCLSSRVASHAGFSVFVFVLIFFLFSSRRL